jgi:di/tricarboxylate transporter
MFFVWGFGSHNVNRKNFGRAALIVYAIIIVLCIVLAPLFSPLWRRIFRELAEFTDCL